ncbi:hypothetical protein N7462_006113 [Penicillium macrosclerotiorum]|uniref:uncharacterized protein n=1 Tax=Penicillium macrosclerotiorum TaxID=303699 RepID=UPI0025489968|nr:uncharacterized protein N7462_006113 [Penicillium macrosclerotiorum]KAJ5682948.1 hypothetical protein N7462_006113 [Penicillium macrosclerotiorum]
MTHPGPLRVLVIVSQRSTLFTKTHISPEDLLPLALRLLKKSNIRRMPDAMTETRLLAVQKWRSRTFLVFDIANAHYDASLGHLPEQNQLPVVVAHFSKKKSAYPASSWVSQRVNHDVAMLHNANGFQAVPPFMEDHTTGEPPTYHSPRDINMLRVKYI